MELSDYIRVLRKSWLIIVAAALVGVAAAAAYSLTRTPLYSSESQVFVSTQGGGTIGELQQGSNFTQARVTTYTNLVTTPIVMAPAIDELDLDMTPSELAEQVTRIQRAQHHDHRDPGDGCRPCARRRHRQRAERESHRDRRADRDAQRTATSARCDSPR